MADAPAAGPAKGKAGLIAFLLTAFFIFLAIEQVEPPAPVPSSAPSTEFSAGRALELLRVIAQKPHPTGTEENARVRDFLVKQLAALGFDVQVQTSTAVRAERRGHGPATAATVNDIVARRKGTGNTRALMLAAHYDSVPTGPGASDDGSGVVTLLETARALKAAPPLRNDLVIVLTDGEELGLLGAQALVERNPWIQNVGVVLNFEARGACGPSMMFETSENNGRLISEFARASSHAVSNSAMFEAYRRLPNDTDLTVFKQAGLPGMNFAFTGCWPRYHTARDDLANISGRSLQHDGVQALALARRFGNDDLARPPAPSKEYFSLFGHVIDYPQYWSGPLTLLAILLFLGVVVFGLRKRLLTIRGMYFGWIIWLAAATVAVALSQGIWIALGRMKLVALLPYGMPYHGSLLSYGFMALVVAVMAAVFASLRRMRVGDLTVGALAWWAILAALTALKAPGANFLFLWPLVASSLELGYAFKQKNAEQEEESVLVWTFPAVTAILIFFPLAFLLVQLVGPTALVAVTAATALLMGILVPMFHIMTAHRRWLLPGAALAAALVCLGTAVAQSGTSARNPRADSLFYALNSDSGKAVWASAGRAPDAWTRQFLSGEMIHGNLSEFLPRSAPLIEHPAPAVELAPPQAGDLEDAANGSERVLRLRITSPRHARVVWVTVEKGRVLKARVNDQPVREDTSSAGVRRWGLVYTNLPAQGMDVILEVNNGEPVTLRVTDQADGLPQIMNASFQPRPAGLMASPAVPFDSTTLVSKTFDFGARPAGKP
jgi:Peptidase family M28